MAPSYPQAASRFLSQGVEILLMGGELNFAVPSCSCVLDLDQIRIRVEISFAPAVH